MPGSFSTHPDGCTFAPRLHRSCTEKVRTTKAEERGRNGYSKEKRENSLSHNSMLHRNRDAHTTPDDLVTVGECVCDLRLSAHAGYDGGEWVWILNRDLRIRPFGCIPEVQRGAIRCKSANLSGVSLGEKCFEWLISFLFAVALVCSMLFEKLIKIKVIV